MTQNDSSSVNNRLIAILLLLAVTFCGFAQKKPEKNPLESFLDTQFWLGLKIGMNYTQAFPETRNTGFSPIDYSADSLNKVYDDFTLPGGHMGLEMNFYHRGFSASFQPAYKRSRYTYSSSIEWQGENTISRFETRYRIEQRLDLIELPLMIKYDVIQSGKIRPFVMAGGFHSIVISAQKEVSVTQIDYSSGNPLRSSGGTTTLGVKDSFQSFSGISGGVGVNLDYWNIRTVLELSYKRGLTPVTKSNVPQDDFASLGEVDDGIHIRDFNISLSLVFPFRFIDQQFKAY